MSSLVKFIYNRDHSDMAKRRFGSIPIERIEFVGAEKELDRPMTETQNKILYYICMFIRMNTMPPTIRDIMRAFDFSSTNGVNDHLKALVKRGMLLKDKASSPRGIVVTSKGDFRFHELIGQR